MVVAGMGHGLGGAIAMKPAELAGRRSGRRRAGHLLGGGMGTRSIEAKRAMDLQREDEKRSLSLPTAHCPLLTQFEWIIFHATATIASEHDP